MAFSKKRKGSRAKSGDAVLADAETAREEEKSEGASWSPKQRAEHLLEEIADSPEKKRAAGDERGAAQTVLAIQSLTSALEKMEARLQRVEAPKLTGPVQLMTCGTCRQSIRNAQGRGVCAGEHMVVMVAPRDMSLWSGFQGVIWNGVPYAGRCAIPLTIVDAVLSQIGRWEAMEKKKFINGGKHFGEVEMSSAMAGRTSIV